MKKYFTKKYAKNVMKEYPLKRYQRTMLRRDIFSHIVKKYFMKENRIRCYE